jgi:hypothetical protein
VVYVAALAILLGLLVGLALGGSPSRLAALRLRHAWLVLPPLLLQLVIFSPQGSVLLDPLIGPLHLLSNALLVPLLYLNRRHVGLLIVGAGLLLNSVVIAANGGYMPVSPDALRAAGMERRIAVLEQQGDSLKATLMTESTPFAFLGDIIPVPPPIQRVFSVGDVVMAVGVVVFVAQGMASGGLPRSTAAPAPER